MKHVNLGFLYASALAMGEGRRLLWLRNATRQVCWVGYPSGDVRGTQAKMEVPSPMTEQISTSPPMLRARV